MSSPRVKVLSFDGEYPIVCSNFNASVGSIMLTTFIVASLNVAIS